MRIDRIRPWGAHVVCGMASLAALLAGAPRCQAAANPLPLSEPTPTPEENTNSTGITIEAGDETTLRAILDLSIVAKARHVRIPPGTYRLHAVERTPRPSMPES